MARIQKSAQVSFHYDYTSRKKYTVIVVIAIFTVFRFILKRALAHQVFMPLLKEICVEGAEWINIAEPILRLNLWKNVTILCTAQCF